VLKVSGAFFLGLVVALASALLYVRVKDRAETTIAPAMQVKSAEPETEPEPAAATEPAPASVASGRATETTVANQPATQPKPVAKSRHLKSTVAARPRIVKAAKAPQPVQVVQNSPTTSAPAYPPIAQPDVAVSVAQPSAAPVVSPSSQSEPAPAEPPHQVTLVAGTALTIRLDETLSTEHNYTGDTFRGTLEQPIVRDGFIIAEKGSKVLGRIVEAIPAGRMRGVSSLRLILTEINTTDGQRVHVQTNEVEKRGAQSTGADAAKIATGAAVGAIIGALGGGGKGAAIGAGAGGAAGTGVVLATRGKPAVLPSESLLTFQLANPVTLTEKLNR
jgi:hypothetical protein